MDAGIKTTYKTEKSQKHASLLAMVDLQKFRANMFQQTTMACIKPF